MRNIQLFVIDPQGSFCNVVDPSEQQIVHDGELCVQGANGDMNRLADFLNRSQDLFNDVHVTLDSHHSVHIAHPIWFKDSVGNHVQPFTLMSHDNGVIKGVNAITQEDLGEFKCTAPSLTKWTTDYLDSLKSQGRYLHCIWPYHCLIGTPGHNIVADFKNALINWERKNFATINMVTKGSNPKTEHFSAVKAEVVDPHDSTTHLNTNFINLIMDADEILIAGEALSHCVAWTIEDIANQFSNGTLGDKDEFIRKCVLLQDCSSSVTGFEQMGDDFVKRMSARGMKLTTTGDYHA